MNLKHRMNIQYKQEEKTNDYKQFRIFMYIHTLLRIAIYIHSYVTMKNNSTHNLKREYEVLK